MRDVNRLLPVTQKLSCERNDCSQPTTVAMEAETTDGKEVLPCPFCGSDNLVLVEHQHLGNSRKADWEDADRLICNRCGMMGPADGGRSLREAWNARQHGPESSSAVAQSYTADEENDAWHADDVEGGISWMLDEYIRLSERLDEGQGEWPKSGYIRNDTWERIKGKHSALRSALNRLGLDVDKIESAV